MRLQLQRLEIQTKRGLEEVTFSTVTFLYGPVSTGKSTVARMIDYCLGGDLEWTPAVRQEFVSATLHLSLGRFDCAVERGAHDSSSVRVSWSGDDGTVGSVNAPLAAQQQRLVDGEVYNFSDLLFHLAGIEPIRVRKRLRDHDSPLVRLSIRDLWVFSYLDQLHLDSSFFRLEDPFRGRKSQDALRFFTGLHSEALSDLEGQLLEAADDQRSKRQAVVQIRKFMERFQLASEIDVEAQLNQIDVELARLRSRRAALQERRTADLHPTDALRTRLRDLSDRVADLKGAATDAAATIEEQGALRAELITAKTKEDRLARAGELLGGVEFDRCPECGTDVTGRPDERDLCRLCGSHKEQDLRRTASEREAVRRDLNIRIDELAESITRRQEALARTQRELRDALAEKRSLDKALQEELARYDSAFVESIREVDREIATLEERSASFAKLQEMPRAIGSLEEEAGALQGRIDRLRSAVGEERSRLKRADENAAAIAAAFKAMMVDVGFPGVATSDEVVLDPRNWKPTVVHGEQEWDFWDTGSGGKKTLFNVCFALALHRVALERSMPVPSLLIIDSPTKNISEDENPALVQALYEEIYSLAVGNRGRGLQFLLIDSDLVAPVGAIEGFAKRRMAGTADAPSLFPHYVGP